MGMLPLRGTLTGWRTGQKSISWHSIKGNAKSYVWRGLTASINSLRANWLESSFAENLRLLVDTTDSELAMCSCSKEADSLLGCIRKCSHWVKGSDPHSALVRLYLQYCVHFWATQYKMHMDILERA